MRKRILVMGVVALCSALACSKDKPAEEKLAPTASALEAAMPQAPGAAPFQVDAAASSFTFLMDAPLEKIDGDAPKSIQGDLFIDPTDLTKSTALLKADLKLLTLYQQKRADEQASYGERKKSDLQNQHAQDWLQINAKDGEVTPEQAETNRWAELKI